MIYTDREKLTSYTMLNNSDKVYFKELSSILMKRPANIIYCEKDEKLYGIISRGDIERAYRAGKNFIVVNKQFTSAKPNEYMRIKQIFKDNKYIKAVPIVNDANELIGDYTSWEDMLAMYVFGQLKAAKFAVDFWQGRKVALVRPCKEFAQKQELMQEWKNIFIQIGVKVSFINRNEVMDTFNLVDYILFTDEDELRGTGALYNYVLDKEFDWEKAKTCGDFFREGGKFEDAFLKAVSLRGIDCFTLSCDDNRSDYWRTLQRDITDKYLKIGKKRSGALCEEFYKDFFAELYSEEYAKKIRSHGYAVTHIDGISKLKDADMETYKVTDGERRTLAQPTNFQKCIYFFGTCFIYGSNVADGHTIESFLQEKINDKGYKVKCVNYGCPADSWSILNRMASTEFNKGDIVILYNGNRKYEEIPNMNLADVCEMHQVPATWMIDDPRHCNHKLTSIYADAIFEMIEPVICQNVEKKELVNLKEDYMKASYLDRYLYGFAEGHNGLNGSIVMNCNPFTLGHRYLIEQALKRVEHLIIFVVEEDKSVFTFKERLAMVAEGTKDLDNITIVPSGNFILSQTTFPEYFLKIEDEDIVHNVEYDITLFAKQIAPALNITCRFVGEELEDKVTNEYNEAMKRILPMEGIHIVEIPRIKIDGRIISASSVREKLLNGENTDQLIPQTTRAILEICWE